MINVLIAEDELLIRMGLESFIPWNELGFNIVGIVSDGQKAWDAYQKCHPDILITDIRMPKLDGIELIKRIRQEDSKCKIIIITCIEYFDVLYQSLDLDITGYLLKASMTHNNLYQLLSQAKREIDSSENPPSASTITDLSINDRFRMYLIDRTISYDEFIAGIPGFHISPIEQCYLLTVYCGFVNKALFQSITGTIKEAISLFGDVLITCNDDKIYLFIQSEQEITFDMISLAMEHLCEYVKNFFLCHSVTHLHQWKNSAIFRPLLI